MTIFSYHVVTIDCSVAAGPIIRQWRYMHIKTSMAGIVLKLATLEHVVETAPGFCTLR